jgi:hypothetical protein
MSNTNAEPNTCPTCYGEGFDPSMQKGEARGEALSSTLSGVRRDRTEAQTQAGAAAVTHDEREAHSPGRLEAADCGSA